MMTVVLIGLGISMFVGLLQGLKHLQNGDMQKGGIAFAISIVSMVLIFVLK